MDEDIQPVTLSNGATLTAEIENESVITVRLLRDQRAAGETIIPYPGHGLAGGHFIVSPSQRFAVLSMFSGQSEEGYELFRIDDSVSRIGSLPYQVGEVASFCFSADESILVMALPSRCSEWWLTWEEGEAEPDGEGRHVFPFGQIQVHEIGTRSSSVHELRVSVPEDWQPTRRARSCPVDALGRRSAATPVGSHYHACRGRLIRNRRPSSYDHALAPRARTASPAWQRWKDGAVELGLPGRWEIAPRAHRR